MGEKFKEFLMTFAGAAGEDPAQEDREWQVLSEFLAEPTVRRLCRLFTGRDPLCHGGSVGPERSNYEETWAKSA
ncbi:MAG: hypothetical protein K6B72_03230 [Lachnospiraceae bacterium]|nr:hypothetical protein [Lachnospiraceae bacterium]